ncbi:hypothetical protein D918_06214 [Trichuris suis]|nr:hypothetical protein D918_06214 [Trichuris suis]
MPQSPKEWPEERKRKRTEVETKADGKLKHHKRCSSPQGTHSSVCKQSKQDELAPQTEKKSNSTEEGH